MTMTKATNPDGTPFLANIHAPSSLTVSINEAYVLAAQLRAQADATAQMVLKAPDTASPELVEQMRQIALDLKVRADAIEAVLDTDKLAQWQAAQGWGRTAKCGSSEPHRAHVFLRVVGAEYERKTLCVGNIDVVVGQPAEGTVAP